MMQNWEEGTIHQIGALPFRGPGQAGESFQKEHQEIQQWEMSSLGKNSLRDQQADTDQLESSFTVKDYVFLVDKFTMNQQCALMAKKGHSLLDCIRQSVGRMLGEIRNPSDYVRALSFTLIKQCRVLQPIPFISWFHHFMNFHQFSEF